MAVSGFSILTPDQIELEEEDEEVSRKAGEDALFQVRVVPMSSRQVAMDCGETIERVQKT